MKPPHLPQSFLGAPTLTPPARPAPTPPAPAGRTVHVPHPVAPPAKDRAAATLSVRLPNRVTLSKALLLAVPALGPGAAVELVPPRKWGGVWHLDCRPTAGRRLPRALGARAEFATSHALKPQHFRDSRIAERTPTQQIKARTTTLRSRLHFRLGPEVAPGYFALVPA